MSKVSRIVSILDSVSILAREAGEAILRIYESDFSVEIKSDGSPLTRADQASHEIIVSGLNRLFSDIPVISEETTEEISFEVRKDWPAFWLVDPLDGTKEFVKRNGEFTVNVALVEKGYPVAGIIYVPVSGDLYYGGMGCGAYKSGKKDRLRAVPVHVRRLPSGVSLTVVKSRSHPSPELDTFLSTLRVGEEVSAGSALKFCIVAEGRADVYPRFGPTMEWDTAAGQAIVEAAGGSVRDMQGNRFRYNKESLKNGYFIVRGGETGSL